MEKRKDKNNYYLYIAEEISSRGTCIRNNYGSIIVKNDEIIATGYTGSPRGRKNCCDLGECRKKRIILLVVLVMKNAEVFIQSKML